MLMEICSEKKNGKIYVFIRFARIKQTRERYVCTN